ncbi:MAG: LuxR C-terminal-related transcriptional regulator [Saprospiraceae bacterium]|jgi:DNA-binding NarL/FixJ family response regulator|nr:response regulator transcription factor [Saprospiraceae bacterium]MBK9565822.1 response regulator transcription factor [Saprospiraceae bacterium]MBP6447037.1 response regulator transcription factor [Saprospiraceae bacterium]
MRFLIRFSAYKDVILYSLSLAILLFVMRWLEIRFIIIDHAIEIYVGAIALIFTGLGIWLSFKLVDRKPETKIVEKTVYLDNNIHFIPNQQEIEKSGISKRELEVLQLMAEGLSNEELAERLYISLNTIKTHTSRLFEKLDVKRRTQAIEKAKRLRLIP